MENLEFAIFEDSVIKVKYPLNWENITRLTRFQLGETILAYVYVPRRKGFLGKIADVISRKPQGGITALNFTLKPFKEMTDILKLDQAIFQTIIELFKGENTEIIEQRKKKFKGKDTYHIIINATFPNGRRQFACNLVVVNENLAIILTCWAQIEKVNDFKETFNMIEESFEIK